MSGAQTPSTDSGATSSDAGRIRVLIVDDHEVLASALALALESEGDLEVVGTAGSIAEAMAQLGRNEVDVLFLDHRLPDGDGISAIPALQATSDTMRIVVLTASTSDDALLAALENGAAGFVSKSHGLDDVLQAARTVTAGESAVAPELLGRLIPRLARRGERGSVQLTERELEVLALVAEGLTNNAIAERLFVSVHTVRNHVANLSAKLGAHSKLEALTIALRDGILAPR